jgi:hypothetical protein
VGFSGVGDVTVMLLGTDSTGRSRSVAAVPDDVAGRNHH